MSSSSRGTSSSSRGGISYIPTSSIDITDLESKDIIVLQALLKKLLGNINVKGKDKPIGKFNISDAKNENIYKINEAKQDLDKEKYKQFLIFMIIELKQNNEEYENNTGEILTAHYVVNATEIDKQEIAKIKEKYHQLYLSKLTEGKTENIKKQIQSRLDKL